MLSTQDQGVRTCDRRHIRGRYQTLYGPAHSSVQNLTAFGAALRRACRTNRMHAALGDHGFFDGGCLSLALALESCIGSAGAIRYVGRPGHLDHAVCAVALPAGTVYLDADGLADASDLKRKMQMIELAGQYKGRLRIARASRAAARRRGIDDWSDASRTLARGLEGLFRSHPDPARWLEA